MNVLTITKPVLIISKVFGLMYYVSEHKSEKVEYRVSKILLLYSLAILHFSLWLAKDLSQFWMIGRSTHNILVVGHLSIIIWTPFAFQLVGRIFLLLQNKSLCGLIDNFQDIFVHLEKINMKPHLKPLYKAKMFPLVISTTHVLAVIGGIMCQYDRVGGIVGANFFVFTELVLSIHFLQFSLFLSLTRNFLKSVSDSFINNLKQNLPIVRIRELMAIDGKVKDAMEELNSTYSVTNWIMIASVFVSFFSTVPALSFWDKLTSAHLALVVYCLIKCCTDFIRAAVITVTLNMVTSEVSKILF